MTVCGRTRSAPVAAVQLYGITGWARGPCPLEVFGYHGASAVRPSGQAQKFVTYAYVLLSRVH